MATGLLERDREIDQMIGAFARVADGEGVLASVSGRPGTGKTSLLNHLTHLSRRSGLRVITLRCEHESRTRPFALLQAFADRDLPRGRAQLLQPLRDGRLITDDQAAEGLYRALSAFADDTPLFIGIDDIHWIDAASLETFLDLRTRMSDLGVFLCVAARSMEPDATPGYRALIENSEPRVLVRELSPEASEAIVSTRFPSCSPVFVQECYRATAGNPFLLVSLLDAIEREGLSPTPDVIPKAAPSDVDRLVTDRIRSLPPDVQAVAKAIAVLGSASDLELVAALAEVTVSEAEMAGGELTARGLLSSIEPTFSHDIVRMALLRVMPEPERASYFRKAAHLTSEGGWDATQVGGLLIQLPGEINASDRRLLTSAAAAALSKGSAAIARRFMERVLSTDQPASSEALLVAGRAFAPTDPETAASYLQQALASEEKLETKVELLSSVGDVFSSLGRHAEAVSAFRQAETIVAPIDARWARKFKARAVTSETLIGGASEEDRAELVRLTEDDSFPLTAEDQNFLLLVAMSYAYFEGRERERAVEIAKRVWDAGRLLESFPPGVETPYFLTGVLYVAGELQMELDVTDALLERDRREASVMTFAATSYVRSCPLYDMGRVEEAESYARSAVETRGWGQYILVAKGFLGLALVEMDDLAGAEAALQHKPPDLEGRMDGSGLLVGLGKLRLEQGRYADAADTLDNAQEAFHAAGFATSDVLPLPHYHFEALWKAGRKEEAKSVHADFRTRAERWGTPRALARELRMRSYLEPEDRSALLNEALRVGREGEAELDNLWIAFELAQEHAQQGNTVLARDLLYPVATSAQQLGCRLLARKAFASLASAGGRPRRIEMTGIQSLTPTEKRVARLVADGLSNTEVAETLFVSVKTVKTHLTAIFRKLEVGSRVALIHRLRDEDL
jgi:DNA-binding NarL/FixJ family response regulator